MYAILCLLMALVCSSCGLGDTGSGPAATQLRSEVLLDADPGWEGTVRIDSVTWLPAMPLGSLGLDDDRLEGAFAARFSNLCSRRVQIRYELRFYDAHTFLVDSFFPLDQPILLEAGQSRRISGEFRLDVPASVVQRLSLLKLAARITAPDR